MTTPTSEAGRPLAIDLFCGLGGWTEGLMAEGYRVVGFDNHRHAYGEAKYPAQLVIQDVLTLHGSQFRNAALIVASPPCQAYSYRAMPWKKAKALPPPDNTLFEACFRIQREASEAAGHHIPLVVENVCGAQKWVGRARWHYGSFYLWGDVPALMPITMKAVKVPTMGAGWYPPDHPKHIPGLAFNGHADRNLREGIKAGDRNKARSSGGHQWTTGFDKHVGESHGTLRGRSSTDAEECSLRPTAESTPGASERVACRSGTDQPVSEFASPMPRGHGAEVVESLNTIANAQDGHKQRGSGATWWRGEVGSKSSKSSARKAASAHIAKIPFPLARHIAASWKPVEAR